MRQYPRLKEVWKELDWNGDSVTLLRQKIKNKMDEGVNVNALSKKVVTPERGAFQVEEYTLYDLAIEAHLSSQKPKANHWSAVMTMLRTLGAKPACQLVQEMSPSEKQDNELDSINLLKNHLFERELNLFERNFHAR